MVSTYRELDWSWGVTGISGRTTKAMSPNGSIYPAETEIIDIEDFVNIGGNICAI